MCTRRVSAMRRIKIPSQQCGARRFSRTTSSSAVKSEKECRYRGFLSYRISRRERFLVMRFRPRDVMNFEGKENKYIGDEVFLYQVSISRIECEKMCKLDEVGSLEHTLQLRNTFFEIQSSKFDDDVILELFIPKWKYRRFSVESLKLGHFFWNFGNFDVNSCRALIFFKFRQL